MVCATAVVLTEADAGDCARLPPISVAVVAAEQAPDVAVLMLLQQCVLQSVYRTIMSGTCSNAVCISYNHVRDVQ
jgi:hypothetical protein